MVFVVVLATCNALHHGVVVVLAPRGVLIVMFKCVWWCLDAFGVTWVL